MVQLSQLSEKMINFNNPRFVYSAMALVIQINIIYSLFALFTPDWFLVNSTYPTLYGLLWAIMNPFYHSFVLYPIVTAFWSTVGFVVNYVLWWRGFMSGRMMVFAIFTNFIWVTQQWTQNITITTFAPIASIEPIFLLFMVFQKLPLGWSLGFSDPHWQSFLALGPNNLGSICTGLDYHIECSTWSAPAWFIYGHHILGYLFLAFWVIYPVYVWVKNGGLRYSYTGRLFLLAKFIYHSIGRRLWG